MTNKFEALNKGTFLDFWGQKYPKCPHCGTVYDIDDNESWELYEDDEHTVTCHSCELEFQVNTIVGYRFSTDEQDENDE